MSMTLIVLCVAVSLLLIIWLTSFIKLNAFLSLFLVSLVLAGITLSGKDVTELLKTGFGNTIASIGLLIIFGTIIGVALDRSGGTLRIASSLLSKTGEGRAPLAIGITGFIAGLPIFCDAGFIILSGVARSFSTKSKIAMPFIGSVLAVSLYAVHCLVPTHPGLLAAASFLKVDIGCLILCGILLAVPGFIAAYLWIRWRTKGLMNTSQNECLNKTHHSEVNNCELPSLLLSLLPIVVPLLLITLSSMLTVLAIDPTMIWVKVLHFVGQPVMALFTGALFSLPLMKPFSVKSLNSLFDNAIEKAGPILIITAAGGMFGLVIKETGAGTYIGGMLASSSLSIAIPFLITFILKTAQGSTTVAVITAASFVEPLLSLIGLDSATGRMLAILAMGAGSMMVSHANDSYFWVVSRFAGIDMTTNLKVYSTATIIMGITVFTCVWIAYLILM
jgi:gluconate:H+ symporter, GntP family